MVEWNHFIFSKKKNFTFELKNEHEKFQVYGDMYTYMCVFIYSYILKNFLMRKTQVPVFIYLFKFFLNHNYTMTL